MGIYVNPDNYAFQKNLNDYIYIDKTDLIACTNDRLGRSSCYLCVSRPRRFGKSMACDMLVSYYSRGCDSKDLFAGRKIAADASFEKHLNQHNVIRLDILRFLKRNQGGLIERIEKAVLCELAEAFPACAADCDSSDLQTALDVLYAKSGERFIFIIDEWDCVFRSAPEEAEQQRDYLDFLRGLFKGAAYVELVYMTGILPIKKYGEHSAINMFTEYSMTDASELSPYYGFTEEEVRAECGKRDVDFNGMKKWYDGYFLDGLHIYNPKSVVDALLRKKFKSYWTGTETYEALKVYIERNFDGLREAVVTMLGGGRCRINTRRFQNDMTTFESKDDVLTLLVHLGYLTYDMQSEEVFIPNLEIEQEFLDAVNNSKWDGLMQALHRSDRLLEATRETV